MKVMMDDEDCNTVKQSQKWLWPFGLQCVGSQRTEP